MANRSRYQLNKSIKFRKSVNYVLWIQTRAIGTHKVHINPLGYGHLLILSRQLIIILLGSLSLMHTF